MTPLFEAVVSRLSAVGLKPTRGRISPFGQELPLVSGWVVDRETGLLALIAECEEEWSDGPWRDVLFAVSGMRNSLADGQATALGPPVVLALTNTAADEQQLLELIETLTGEFLLFGRMDVSLVSAQRVMSAEGPVRDELDQALAPLLPVCREALRESWAVDPRALRSFGDELALKVDQLAGQLVDELPDAMGEYVDAPRREFRDRLREAVVVPEQPAIEGIWSEINMHDFRAAGKLDVGVCAATVVEGLNGTGKSSLFEAAEILWTGTSTRQPPDVSTEEYAPHLYRAGEHPFRLEGVDPESSEDPTVREGLEGGLASLSRCVLHQDHLRQVVDLGEKERYAWFLDQTGLRAPRLRELHNDLHQEAFAELNRLLAAFGIDELPRRNLRIDTHLKKMLGPPDGLEWEGSSGSDALRHEVRETAEGHGWRYLPKAENPTGLDMRLRRFEELCAESAKRLRGSDELTEAAHTLERDFQLAAQAWREEALAIRRLVATPVIETATEQESVQRPQPVPPQIVSRWLASLTAIETQANELEAMCGQVDDKTWRERLVSYVGVLRSATRVVERDELAELRLEGDRSPRTQLPPAVGPSLLDTVGLIAPEGASLPSEVATLIARLADRLDEEAHNLERLAGLVRRYPAVKLLGREDELLTVAARFSLARALEKPISEAEATVLTRVTGESLRSVFAELVAALTRFEWYFKPARLSAKRDKLSMNGIVVDEDKLELRMLLNSGERSIVGLAWFLALHLLQDQTHRQILMLDDPFGGLDPNNRASAVATLRTFARLCKPRFFLVSTHDQELGEQLAREFGPANDWPREIGRIRFKRRSDNSVTVKRMPVCEELPELSTELDRLGFRSASSA